MAESSKKSVVLGVTGGIAAYKAAELVRELARNGIEVQVVMTEAAGGLVAPATFQALSGKPVYTNLWDPRGAGNMPRLLRRGRAMLGPASGDQACGEVALGRMLEARVIAEAVTAFLSPKTLRGARV